MTPTAPVVITGARARLPAVRLRRTAPFVAGAAVALGLMAVSCGDDGPGDTARFCAEVQDNLPALVTPPSTADDVDSAVLALERARVVRGLLDALGPAGQSGSKAVQAWLYAPGPEQVL